MSKAAVLSARVELQDKKKPVDRQLLQNGGDCKL